MEFTELSELIAGRTSRLWRSTKDWPWPMSFSRISLESQKHLASRSRSYIESTVSGRSRFNATSSLDAGPADGSNWRRTPRELYSDQPSHRHSSKENSMTRSSGDRCSAGGSGCQSGAIREHLDEPLRGTFFRANVRIKTNSIRVPVQSREKFP